MRTKDKLIDSFENMKILFQYLYMDEDHYIDIDNMYTTIRIRMDERGIFRALNTKFPNVPEMAYNENMYLGAIEAMIEQLKKQKSKYDYFDSKWEEIQKITASNMSLNALNKD